MLLTAVCMKLVMQLKSSAQGRRGQRKAAAAEESPQQREQRGPANHAGAWVCVLHRLRTQEV